MKDLEFGRLIITIISEDKNIMKWQGISDDVKPDKTLDPYFDELIPSLVGKELYVDFYKLQYLNSATVPSLARLIITLNNNNIKTMISYNEDSTWQETSFRALSHIINGLEYVTLEGKKH